MTNSRSEIHQLPVNNQLISYNQHARFNLNLIKRLFQEAVKSYQEADNQIILASKSNKLHIQSLTSYEITIVLKA